MSHPPTRRKGAAHSATTAGDPKERTNHSIERGSVQGIPPVYLCPLVHDAHPLPQVTGGHRTLEELGPAFIRFEEHECGLRPGSGDHQTGESAARSEIKDPGTFPRRLQAGQGYKPSGVAQVAFDRPGTEESGIARQRGRPAAFLGLSHHGRCQTPTLPVSWPGQ